MSLVAHVISCSYDAGTCSHYWYVRTGCICCCFFCFIITFLYNNLPGSLCMGRLYLPVKVITTILLYYILLTCLTSNQMDRFIIPGQESSYYPGYHCYILHNHLTPYILLPSPVPSSLYCQEQYHHHLWTFPCSFYHRVFLPLH